jgi:alpha-galactosidase
MGKTIVLLGVGSTYFTKGIVESVIKYGGEWELKMVDIDEKCLDVAMKLGHRLTDHYKSGVKISGSVNRLDVLEGADAVVSTIGVGGRKAWEQDVFMFRQFNIYQSTGDTFGAGGLSRAIRTIPVLLEVAADMERLCPDALLVNFTNPMSPNCWALNKYTKIKTIGLCYGVTGIQRQLADAIGVPYGETWTKAVGVNHFTWITHFTHNGKCAWDKVREVMANDASKRVGGQFTWELFETFGAFPAVGDGHICEFMPLTQAKGAYYGKTFGVDGGHDFEHYAKYWDNVCEDMEAQAYGKAPLAVLPEGTEAGSVLRDEDLFIDVTMAYLGGGKAVERTVNLPNRGIIPNLPPDSVLEVTALTNSSGFHPYNYGEMPAGLNAILQRITASHALTVEASVSGDRNILIQALIADSVAVNRQAAEKIADCILETHKAYLPHFR